MTRMYDVDLDGLARRYRDGATLHELLQLYGDSEIRAAVDAGEIIGTEIMDAGLKARVRRYVPRVWLPPRLLERLGL